MTIENIKLIRVLLLATGFVVLVPLIAQARTVKLTCGGQRTITAAVERLKPGDTLLVEGVCVENVVIPAQVVDVILDGQGTATINGPDTTKGTITVNGKNITIQNFASITGGRYGIFVNSGTATIANNTIQGVPGNAGINVNSAGFAAIVLNTIQNNVENGIVVNGSAADIGFLSPTDTTASPNTIQNNGSNGIVVTASASARIEGNTMSGNMANGILVTENSNARIGFISGSAGTLAAPNVVQNNQGAGIVVTRSSGARISPNTISNNMGGGIVVDDGSTADIGPEVGVPGSFNTITGNGAPVPIQGMESLWHALHPRGLKAILSAITPEMGLGSSECLTRTSRVTRSIVTVGRGFSYLGIPASTSSLPIVRPQTIPALVWHA